MHTIRRIRSDEGAMLRDLRLRALRDDPDAFGSSYQREVDRSGEAWEKWAVESAAGQRQCLFVAESRSSWVGLAGAYTHDSEPQVRRLFGMWVHPEARAAGIGAGLVDVIVDWSIESGAEEVRLWVVEANDSALGLYLRKGFEETGELQPLPSNPSLTETQMVLRLTEPPVS
jgi:ribosomal protein S18 acetylase RimI-like enzyme